MKQSLHSARHKLFLLLLICLAYLTCQLVQQQRCVSDFNVEVFTESQLQTRNMNCVGLDYL